METVLSSWYSQYKTLHSKDSSKLSNSSSAVQGGFMNITKFRRISFGFGRRWLICFNVGLCVWVCGFSFFFWRLPLFLFALSCYFSQTSECVSRSPDPNCGTGKDVKSFTGQRSGLVVWNSKRWQFIHVGHLALQSPLQQPFPAPRMATFSAQGFFWLPAWV